MPSAERVLVIARPQHVVFEFFTDPDNDPKWRTGIKEIRAEAPIAVGTHIHQVIAGPAGRGIPADLEVRAYEPHNRYAFAVISGPVRPEGEFRFATTEEGHTELTFSLRAEVRGLMRLFMTRTVQKSMDAEIAALDTAKRVLETAA